ncbi:MAG: DUF5985 family protein [Hyphomicrobiaceae bacterium]|nr:DUF5985 family protein [Hyphomicrobiaceae bacterium]
MDINAVLLGAIAMASFVAALCFMRFWRQTRDRFFLFFAFAFAADCATRLALSARSLSGESEPLFYLARLMTFLTIIAAILDKNRGSRR